MAMLTERYADRLAGMLSCYDRIVITGTLPGVCYAQGMTSFLNAKGIRIFDYPQFAAPLRDRVRECAQALATKHGVPIQHINKANVRKEDVVAKVLKERGDQPGLVHIISAMEACASYQPWHDKNTGKTFLRPANTTAGRSLEEERSENGKRTRTTRPGASATTPLLPRGVPNRQPKRLRSRVRARTHQIPAQ